MKKYILMFLCMSALVFANNQKEFKLRDIAKPNVWALTFQVPWICTGSLSALRGLLALFLNRDLHGDLYHNNLVVHGPDSVFLYIATQYPALQRYLSKIFMAFTKSMTINQEKLEQFLKAKREGTGILTYGDDIDVPLRLIASLKEQGWSNEKIDDFLNKLTIKVHNSDNVIAFFKDYLAHNSESISPDFKPMLDKKINSKKYIPNGYSWTFERVQK